METNRIPNHLTRRDFLALSAAGTASLIVGCAVNPVTGRRQFMLMSEDQEIGLDQSHSPHQFSADYGSVQDEAINSYLTDVGKSLAATSHRPNMPYSFRAVNATYVNAYAFPGGSIAVTRGILASLENEAELAALLGHEIGHVNARHTAERMTKTMLFQSVLVLGTIFVASKDEKAAPWVAGLGSLGAGILLARYSRDDEREADSLGMEYMVKGGYGPGGMVGLMELLQEISRRRPNVIEMMFSTHPMSEERYQTAVSAAGSEYAEYQSRSDRRERYMDHTARIRRMKAVIDKLQSGEKEMAQERYSQAASEFKTALSQAPNDYAGLLMMAKSQIALEKYSEAVEFASHARDVYPTEAQAYHVEGYTLIQQKKYAPAYDLLNRYEQMLPGNPNTVFYKGYAQEGMDHKPKAAEEYQRYLKLVSEGEMAEHARKRLIEWGYMEDQT